MFHTKTKKWEVLKLSISLLVQGQVVRKLIKANPWLKVNQGFHLTH